MACSILISMVRQTAKYHHNCHNQYSPYNIERKQRSLQNKIKQFQDAESSYSLRFSTGSNSRGFSNLANPNHICNICGEPDVIENHAAAFHASKSKLNVEHVMKLANKWRYIAAYIGDLGTSSSFYHKCCSTNLYNRFTKTRKEGGGRKIDVDQVKAAAWDMYMFSKSCISNPSTT